MPDTEDLQKARKLLQDDKVAQIVDDNGIKEGFFVVTGSKDDYLVILPHYCTCTHFHLTCIKEPGKVCKHILAVKLAGKNTRKLKLDDWQDLIFRYR